MNVYIDCETQSPEDLKKVGAQLYWRDAWLMALCFAVEMDGILLTGKAVDHGLEDGPAQYLCDLAKRPDTIFVAHHAAFEQVGWQKVLVEQYGFPPLPIERWKCTMAKCLAHGLPASLEHAAQAVGLPVQKDMDGQKIMLSLSKPKRDGTFWRPHEKPDEFQKMYEYCSNDVHTTRLLDRALRDLSPLEQKIWQLDQRMNQRGVMLDLVNVHRAINLIEQHNEHTAEAFQKLVPNVKPTQRAKFTEWLAANGVKTKDLTAGTVSALKQRTDLPRKVARALRLYSEAQKTSLAKYPQMVLRSDSNGVTRENLAYHGAHTGRWTGRGIQLQNLARPTVNAMNVVEALTLGYEAFKFCYDDVATALSSAIRGMIVPMPGNRFYVGDFASIEAIVVAWLAGEQSVLDSFRKTGDIYCPAASGIYGRTITKKDKEERQVGKVSVLALGYEGGIGAFAKMCSTYGISLKPIAPKIVNSASQKELELAEYGYLMYLKRTAVEDQVSKAEAYTADIIKQRWRKANPEITTFWKELSNAAIEAVQYGQPVQVGRVRFFTHSDFLFCRLPSGRCMAYPKPILKFGERSKVTLSYQSSDVKKGFRGRVDTYGGMFAENITQAVSRDIMTNAMLALEEHGYEVVLTVHDEILCERSADDLDEFPLERFLEVMADVPDWGRGLPIRVEGWEGFRYDKR